MSRSVTEGKGDEYADWALESFCITKQFLPFRNRFGFVPKAGGAEGRLWKPGQSHTGADRQ